jgi:hypothetical protein
MKSYAVALAILIFGAAFAPVTVDAATGTTVNYVLTTWQKDVMSGGQYNGSMRIYIRPDGVVGGTFMTTQGELSQIVGGLSGTKIWLQIGDRSPGRQKTYEGTFVAGKLTATAQGAGLHTWSLEGKVAEPGR